MWNGTDDTLNPSPITTSAPPATSSGLPISGESARNSAMRPRFVLPVAPYISAMPYSRKPLANAPSKKYLSAASFDSRWLRRNPTST